MTRSELINFLIKRNNYKSYLEIGVNTPSQPGWNFDNVSVQVKHGVDPADDVEATYKMTSDIFFDKHIQRKYDIIFIDGLHIFEQAYKDIINSLEWLNEGGTIVVHDCNPVSEITQRRIRASSAWHGDVWKAILRLRIEEPNVSIYTIDTDEGCTVIQKGKQEQLNVKNAGKDVYTYSFFKKNKKKILNLISVKEFAEKMGENPNIWSKNTSTHNKKAMIEQKLKHIYKKTFKKVFPGAGDIVETFLINELKDASRIIDLGCGPSSPLGRIKGSLKKGVYMLGVDDFDPYLEVNRKNKIHSEYLKSNIFNVNFPAKSFDCAILLDVIEHFNKQDFLNFLPKLEKITKKIIVMTPNGFINQDEYDKNAYQIHRSGWTAKELRDLGFTCYGVSGLKFLRGEHAVSRIKPLVIGNVISNMSEPLVRTRPEKAFHLLCVKNCK